MSPMDVEWSWMFRHPGKRDWIGSTNKRHELVNHRKVSGVRIDDGNEWWDPDRHSEGKISPHVKYHMLLVHVNLCRHRIRMLFRFVKRDEEWHWRYFWNRGSRKKKGKWTGTTTSTPGHTYGTEGWRDPSTLIFIEEGSTVSENTDTQNGVDWFYLGSMVHFCGPLKENQIYRKEIEGPGKIT